MIFTRAQLEELYAAIDEKDTKKIEIIVTSAQKTLSSDNPLKRASPFYVACAEGLDELADFYLSAPQFNISDVELYDGLQVAAALNVPDVVDLLISKYNLDPNYILPQVNSTLYKNGGKDMSDIVHTSLLARAAALKDDKMLRCLLAHNNVAVNMRWSNNAWQGETALVYTAMYRANNLNNIKILLENGAAPAPILVGGNPGHLLKHDFITWLRRLHEEDNSSEHNEVISLLKSWQGRVEPKPYVDALKTPAPRTFQTHEFNAASAFMNRYKARCKDPEVQAQTPFVIACMEGKAMLSVVKCFVENKRFDEQELYQAIYLATWFQNDAAVELIINKFADSTLGTEAASETVVKLIEQARSDFDAYKRQGLHKGKNKRAKNIDAVELMEKFLSSLEERLSNSGSHSPGHSSDSDKEPQSAGSGGSNNSPPSSPEKLRLQPVNEELEKQFFIQKTKVSIDELKKLYFSGITMKVFHPTTGETAFHSIVSIRNEHNDRIEALLNWGVDINIRDRDGRTVLHKCANQPDAGGEWYQLEILNFILKPRPHLKHQANVNVQDKEGNTALHYAALTGKNKVLLLLLERGGDPTITNNAGYSVLRCAQEAGDEWTQLEILNFVFKPGQSLKYKIDLNLPDKDGNTPLHVAAFTGKNKVLSILLERGGDPTIKNRRGHDVFACATACSLPQRSDAVLSVLQTYMNKRVATRPVMQQPAEIKYSQPQPTTYHQPSSYASPSSPSLFKVSSYVAPLPAATAVQIPREVPASQRMPAQQVGTLYATPVSKDSLKLSKNAKPAPESDPNHSDHKKKSGGLLGKVKGLF